MRQEKNENIIEISEDVRLPGTDFILEAGDKIRVITSNDLKEGDDLEAAKERMTNWTVNVIRTGKGRRGKPLTREEVKELLYFRYSNTETEILDEILERAYEIVERS